MTYETIFISMAIFCLIFLLMIVATLWEIDYVDGIAECFSTPFNFVANIFTKKQEEIKIAYPRAPYKKYSDFVMFFREHEKQYRDKTLPENGKDFFDTLRKYVNNDLIHKDKAAKYLRWACMLNIPELVEMVAERNIDCINWDGYVEIKHREIRHCIDRGNIVLLKAFINQGCKIDYGTYKRALKKEQTVIATYLVDFHNFPKTKAYQALVDSNR